MNKRPAFKRVFLGVQSVAAGVGLGAAVGSLLGLASGIAAPLVGAVALFGITALSGALDADGVQQLDSAPAE